MKELWEKLKKEYKINIHHQGSLGSQGYISELEFGNFLDEADKVIDVILNEHKKEIVKE